MALEISRLCLFSRDVFPFQRPCWNGEHPRIRISLVAASRERAWEGGQASFMQGRTRLTHTLTHAREGGTAKSKEGGWAASCKGGQRGVCTDATSVRWVSRDVRKKQRRTVGVATSAHTLLTHTRAITRQWVWDVTSHDAGRARVLVL